MMSYVTKSRKRNNILKVGSKNLNTENWAVYHPDGTHMFTCGENKANWYLTRDLAKRMGDGKIILTFEPKGTGFDEDEIFGKSSRERICVVSGVDDNLQRHHIVPYCYRAFFPEQYKSKNHHDVVLINFERHSDYEKIADNFKDVVAEMFGVKTISELNMEYTAKLHNVGKDGSVLLNDILFLFRTYNKVSNEEKLIKLQKIATKTGIPFETICGYNYIQYYKLYQLLKTEQIKKIKSFKENNRMIYDHGYHVAQQLDTEEKIMTFVKLWRNHFIDTMNPQFMPNGWSVDFRIKTNI